MSDGLLAVHTHETQPLLGDPVVPGMQNVDPFFLYSRGHRALATGDAETTEKNAEQRAA